LEHRFDRTPDGGIWTRSQFPLALWGRSLEVSGAVRAVARVRDLPAPEPGSVRADGDGVEFAAIAHYIGPADYARRARAVKREARAAVDPRSAVIMRVRSHLAAPIQPLPRRREEAD